MNGAVHSFLPCGMELGVLPLPARHLVSFQIRFICGLADEPADRLGLAHVLEETLDKGTKSYSAQAFADAFDAIGAGRQSGTGRETMTFTCTVLPQHFERAVELHAEMFRNPTFPADAVAVNVDLSKQELLGLQDEAQAYMEKLVARQAYGPTVGRHALGEPELLDKITRDDLVAYWKKNFHAGRMISSVAGAVDAGRAAEVFQKYFDGFGDSARAGRSKHPIQFTPGTRHHSKELEQEHINICWPGVDATHGDFPIQQVTLGILSGGMSGRLFTEVREKRGLVYWVSAWHETPRGMGMMFLGASTTPERCDLTYATLLHEVDRLADDITQDELDRAVTSITASQETRGDATRSKCAELAGDLFFFGRPIPVDEKLEKVRRVTIGDVRAYLGKHGRDRLCVNTLGPRALTLDDAKKAKETAR